MSDRTRRPASGQPASQAKGKGQSSPGATGAASGGSSKPSAPSHGPSGTRRQGRRETERPRQAATGTPTLIATLRKPLLVAFVVLAVAAGGLLLVTQAAAPAYACTSVDTVQSPAPGALGQVQPDQGNGHVAPGDKVTYAVCPPASGKHINQEPQGPIPPKLYGPDEKPVPNGWVHNLEHGGLVLLYSCDKGPCDASLTSQLQAFASQVPATAICKIPPGDVTPVIARFEQMPTRFAALLWDRALYLDTLDTKQIDDFYLRYGEVIQDGVWVAPPEPQCPLPSASAAASASPAPSASGG